MLKRLFDIVFSALGLLLMSPVFLVLAIWIKLDSEGPVFYRQVRVGRHNKDFRIFKFRSMRVGSDKGSLITIGGLDPRITRSGYFIRRFKLDEFPQLINVLKGDMSFVGPRPEVRHYVDFYTEEQMHVLDVRPGITDMASIKYRNENELLDSADDPEQYYINVILPDKLRLNLEYVENSSLFYDMKMICLTVWSLSFTKLFHSLISWYFGKDAIPYWCVLCLDCAILIGCFFFSIYCILGGDGVRNYFWEKLSFILLCLVPYLVCYKALHTYNNIIRYSSFIDIRNLIFANLIGSAVVMVMHFTGFNRFGELFPGQRVIIYTFAFSTVVMCLWRILAKITFDSFNVREEARRIAIYGVQSGGVRIAKSIRCAEKSEFKPYCFISPRSEKSHRTFMCGLPVYAEGSHLATTLQRHGIKCLMVSPLQIGEFRSNDELINMVTSLGIQIYVVPSTTKWDTGRQSALPLKEIDIEDLLPRDSIDIDMHAIGEMLTGKTIMITGAAGSIGSEMVRQVVSFSPARLLLIDQAETPMHDIRLFMKDNYPEIECATIVASITHSRRMESLFDQYRPSIVFHAAAYKHVPMMEDNPAEAVLNNIYGTKVVADLSVKYGVSKFVMISTDKAVNPTNVMGCSKRICEIYCQSLNKAIQDGTCPIKAVSGKSSPSGEDSGKAPVTQFVTTRFGNVLGSNGSVIPIFKKQIKQGGPVTVTDPDIVRFFMLIPEAAKLVLQAGTFGHGGEIMVFDMGKPVRILDLAKRMIALSGAKDVKIEFTGLRDGEKLHEEVLSRKEENLPTSHPKIQVARVREYPYDTALSQISGMIETAKLNGSDNMAIVKLMKQMVPEYVSNHSVYSQLDHK